MKAIVWQDDTMGAEYVTEEIPAETQKESRSFHAQFGGNHRGKRRRNPAQFLEGEEIKARSCALRCASRPSLEGVFRCASEPLQDKGVQPLLDAVVDYLPSPLDVGETKGTNPTMRAHHAQACR